MEGATVAMIQQVLAGLNITDSQLQANATATPTQGTPLPPVIAAILPGSLSAVLTFLFSFSALKDWVKLFLIGGIFETCRRSASYCYNYLVSCFFINAYFEEDDASYEWMMVWLTRHSPMKRARNIEVSTRTFGIYSPSLSYDSDGDPMVASRERKISLLPYISASYTLWYKWRRVTITRTERQKGYYGRTEETLVVTMLTWNQEPLLALLEEAKREYIAAQVNRISIYYADTSNNWRTACTRPKRPLTSIVLDPGVKDLILDDARDFLESRPWYEARGIPFRRGYLLWGAPGSGKTSVIHALAGELGLDVYVISLSRIGLDDTSLSELISSLPERCIALMEDIDAAFHHGLSREAATPAQSSTESSTSTPTPGNPPPAPTVGARVTLSGLLNALDGVGAQEGRILFATTNKYLSLDPALCRPGRMDIHVEFKLASKYQAQELFKRFYLPDDVPKEAGVLSSAGDQKLEKMPVDSGYNSTENLIDLIDAASAPSATPDECKFNGLAHRSHASLFTPAQIEALAERFTDAIPERELSMASLQGYLMCYKGHPERAVANAVSWVLKEKEDKMKKAQMQSGATNLSTPQAVTT